jgi:arsenate reductase (thioredoxin)
VLFEGAAVPVRKQVLFVCVENAGRSQMAEAFARLRAGNAIDPHSAGSKPSGRINPDAITAMKEVGYDLAAHKSKSLDEIPAVEYDAVVTMGCGDACPFVRARQRFDWNIPDPKGKSLEEVRQIRDVIDSKVQELCEALAFEAKPK